MINTAETISRMEGFSPMLSHAISSAAMGIILPIAIKNHLGRTEFLSGLPSSIYIWKYFYLCVQFANQFFF